MMSARHVWMTGAAIFATLFGIVGDVQLSHLDRIVSTDAVPRGQGPRYAIVLGASVKSDGTPSDALRDRLDEGIALHDAHAAQKIFLTGDDGAYHADEIDVMKPYLLQHGVPEADIVVDGRGYRTYESCKHAKELGATPAIIVTQRFHLARALYLCNALGVDAIGIPSDKRIYTDIIPFWTRDLAASVEAWWDINIHPPASPVPGPT